MSTQADGGARPQSSAEQILDEARKAFFVMVAFLAVIWALQLANVADHYGLDHHYGIIPRDATRLPGVLLSPLLHFSWSHIEANSGPLFVFGFLAAYRGVYRFLGLTLFIVVVSGFAVWAFQSKGLTVGASGLVFGYFGYIIVRGIFDRHMIDIAVGLVMALCFAYTVTGALPGTPGVSWIDHMSGLAAGVVGGWIFRDRAGAPARASAAASAGEPGDTLVETKPGKTVATKSGDRAALYKELDDLGL